MMLIVSPSALNTMMEVRIDRGSTRRWMSVLRQLLRNRRIISAVSAAAITAPAPRLESTPGRRATDRRAADRQGRRQPPAAWATLLDPRDDVECRCVATFCTIIRHCALAVDARDVGLRRVAVAQCATSRM